MDDLVRQLPAWGAGTFLLVALLFGFAPVFAVNVLARVYPRGHPRRAEMVAELWGVPRRERLIWVAEQIPTVLFDAVPERWRRWRKRRQRRGWDNSIVLRFTNHPSRGEEVAEIVDHYRRLGCEVQVEGAAGSTYVVVTGDPDPTFAATRMAGTEYQNVDFRYERRP